ncbi:TolC family protein [Aestuariibacter halophilus]|uniref:TolC family protein n=1 Tax=Fluctibacter halophilus TaxID=226011 RepID=A0ABS8G376_9ALTE|nr:TolC family protein [Aestuariibacter halophilus]MCC2615029.1 TolC family protein [Aestuariibacter halophilus]
MFRCFLSVIGATFALGVNAQSALSLPDAVRLAQENDVWLQGNVLQQSAIESRAIAAGSLPDPTVAVSVMNLPTDSFDFDQEAMTQLKVGVSQMLPRGDSRALQQQRLTTDAQRFPLMRDDRRAKVRATVSQLWLDAYAAQQTLNLIEQDKTLFEQLVDVSRASYASASGKARQQDIIRAQLELLQLQDRLTVQRQRLETVLAQLTEWLPNPVERVDATLPTTKAAASDWMSMSTDRVLAQLQQHPSVLAIDVRHQVAQTDIDLARQQFKPQWGVNASYAVRDDSPQGMQRADFFSVGVTFDVPLFTDNRQDPQLAASVASAEAVKTDKRLLLRQLLSAVQKEQRQLASLQQRRQLYAQQLIVQVHEQAEAALTAYTNDDGDFAEVVRARIAELNTKVAALQIAVDERKAMARLMYLLFPHSQSLTGHTGDPS